MTQVVKAYRIYALQGLPAIPGVHKLLAQNVLSGKLILSSPTVFTKNYVRIHFSPHHVILDKAFKQSFLPILINGSDLASVPKLLFFSGSLKERTSGNRVEPFPALLTAPRCNREGRWWGTVGGGEGAYPKRGPPVAGARPLRRSSDS